MLTPERRVASSLLPMEYIPPKHRKFQDQQRDDDGNDPNDGQSRYPQDRRGGKINEVVRHAGDHARIGNQHNYAAYNGHCAKGRNERRHLAVMHKYAVGNAHAAARRHRYEDRRAMPQPPTISIEARIPEKPTIAPTEGRCRLK